MIKAPVNVLMTDNRSSFLETAARIGQRLCRMAVWDGERCYWVGLTPVQVANGFQHQKRPLGPDLYSGATGNLYFLSRLFRLTGEGELFPVAVGAAKQALARLEDVPPPGRISFYLGWTGVAFALYELAEAFGATEWLKQGRRLLKQVAKLDLETQAPDVLVGIAGAIPPLLNMQARQGGNELGEFAHRLGQKLIKLARRRDCGWSWPPFGPLSHLHRDDLTGFAHGAGGTAWALLELYAASGEEQYLQATEEGFRYERSWYRSEAENWLDLRYFPGPDGDLNTGTICQLQWCHGAVGIGLTRLRAFQLLQQPSYRAEAEAAIRSTLRDLELFPHNWQPNYSLCHGLAGNADFLLEGSLLPGQESLRAVAERVGLQGIELYEQTGTPWPSALSQQEIPGLMTGVAGTAYFYLRLYDPERTPPITLVTSGRRLPPSRALSLELPNEQL